MVRRPTLSDMPSEVMRNIVISAASAPRPTQYWHVPMLRNLARMALTNRGINELSLVFGESPSPEPRALAKALVRKHAARESLGRVLLLVLLHRPQRTRHRPWALASNLPFCLFSLQ